MQINWSFLGQIYALLHWQTLSPHSGWTSHHISHSKQTHWPTASESISSWHKWLHRTQYCHGRSHQGRKAQEQNMSHNILWPWRCLRVSSTLTDWSHTWTQLHPTSDSKVFPHSLHSFQCSGGDQQMAIESISFQTWCFPGWPYLGEQ